MPRIAHTIKLSKQDLRSLTNLLSKGSAKARVLTRARTLDLLHRNHHPKDITATLRITTQSVFNLKRRFLVGGLQAALYDKPRPGRPIEID